MHVDLLILNFSAIQTILNDFHRLPGCAFTPVICLTGSTCREILRWNHDQVVFVFPENADAAGQSFSAHLHSILTLAGSHRPSAIQTHPGSLVVPAALSENRSLSRYVMEIEQKSQVLNRVREKISSLYRNVDDSTRKELLAIVSSIKSSMSNTRLWEDFKLYYQNTDPDFLFKLANRHPELTSRDIKYCCYLKMNMSNEDIMNLLGINQESVRTHKYRLKRKLNLPKNTSLASYLQWVSSEA
ncbi:MAG: hypothetical protein IM638_07805 [Bacteroidetes bacterium]|nr:hypothetical protein [Bacteroidota bacterium]